MSIITVFARKSFLIIRLDKFSLEFMGGYFILDSFQCDTGP